MGTEMSDDPRQRRIWEQHGQTIMLFVITSALGFATKTLWDSNALQASLVVQIKYLTEQVSELRQTLNSSQQNNVSRSEFVVHEQRLQALERTNDRRR